MLNSRNEIVAQNTDNYSNGKYKRGLKVYFGADFLAKNWVVGGLGFGLRGNKSFFTGKLGINIPFRNKDQLKK